MKPTKHIYIPFLLCSIFILLPSCTNRKVDQKALSQRIEAAPITPPASVIQYPAEQFTFHETNLRFRNQLRSANNDIQRATVVNECDRARSKFFKEKKSRLNNWVGKIADIRNENKGAWAFLRIVSEAAGFPIFYQTHYQRWPTWKENSILEKGTKTYQQVSRLSIGQIVSFSGTIIGSLYYSYSEDKSIDLESVNSPKIILKFNNVIPFAFGNKE
jgi:hypothetical protein